MEQKRRVNDIFDKFVWIVLLTLTSSAIIVGTSCHADLQRTAQITMWVKGSRDSCIESQRTYIITQREQIDSLIYFIDAGTEIRRGVRRLGKATIIEVQLYTSEKKRLTSCSLFIRENNETTFYKSIGSTGIVEGEYRNDALGIFIQKILCQ